MWDLVLYTYIQVLVLCSVGVGGLGLGWRRLRHGRGGQKKELQYCFSYFATTDSTYVIPSLKIGTV